MLDPHNAHQNQLGVVVYNYKPNARQVETGISGTHGQIVWLKKPEDSTYGMNPGHVLCPTHMCAQPVHTPNTDTHTHTVMSGVRLASYPGSVSPGKYLLVT